MTIEGGDRTVCTIFPDNGDISLGKSLGKSGIAQGDGGAQFDDAIKVARDILENTIDNSSEDHTLGGDDSGCSKLTVESNENDCLSIDCTSNGERAGRVGGSQRRAARTAVVVNNGGVVGGAARRVHCGSGRVVDIGRTRRVHVDDTRVIVDRVIIVNNGSVVGICHRVVDIGGIDVNVIVGHGIVNVGRVAVVCVSRADIDRVARINIILNVLNNGVEVVVDRVEVVDHGVGTTRA